MRKNSIKNTRINGEVQKELSNIIRGEIKDPRINPLTIEYGVKMSKMIDDVTKDIADKTEE